MMNIIMIIMTIRITIIILLLFYYYFTIILLLFYYYCTIITTITTIMTIIIITFIITIEKLLLQLEIFYKITLRQNHNASMNRVATNMVVVEEEVEPLMLKT